MTATNAADRAGAVATDELMALEPAEVMARFRRGLLNRRDVVKLLGALGMAAVGRSLRASGVGAADDLNIVCWAGYDDKSFVKPFEDADHAKLTFTEAASSDEMFTSMQAGGGKNFDMVSASNDLTQRLVEADLVMEIDPSRLTNFGKLFDQFKRPPYLTFNNKLYGVNFSWGPTYLIYNPDVIETPPDSWRALLDEQYTGKICAWDAPIQIAQYALLLTPRPEDPYKLTDDQLNQVKTMVSKQRSLLRTYWHTGGDLAQLWESKEVVIADAWPWITLQIQKDGGSVAAVLPKEGVTGWSDSWMISKKTPNPDLALKWADYMIGEQGQMGIVNAVNYSITNKEVAAKLPPARQKELRLDDVPAEYARIQMWRKKDDAKWLKTWTEATQG